MDEAYRWLRRCAAWARGREWPHEDTICLYFMFVAFALLAVAHWRESSALDACRAGLGASQQEMLLTPESPMPREWAI